MLDELASSGDDVFVKAGYIRVFQDVRVQCMARKACLRDDLPPPSSGR